MEIALEDELSFCDPNTSIEEEAEECLSEFNYTDLAKSPWTLGVVVYIKSAQLCNSS